MRNHDHILFKLVLLPFGLDCTLTFALNRRQLLTIRFGQTARIAALLIDPLDTPQIAATMQRILEDGELRLALDRRGPDIAAAYTWERAAERVYGEPARAMEIGAAAGGWA